jgi:hypothetical protein
VNFRALRLTGAVIGLLFGFVCLLQVFVFVLWLCYGCVMVVFVTTDKIGSCVMECVALLLAGVVSDVSKDVNSFDFTVSWSTK